MSITLLHKIFVWPCALLFRNTGTLSLRWRNGLAITLLLAGIASVQSPAALGETLPLVRLNQVGYLPYDLKRATINDSSKAPLGWTLYNAANLVVATGTTTVFGDDVASGQHVHIADFSAYTTEGTSYTLEVADERSHPFTIDFGIYGQMKYDALAYFYHNRSGIAITMPSAGDVQWTRLAGHIDAGVNQGDYDVPCFNGKDTFGNNWEGCNYTLDVVGGWYDAGDHGKYVVNGGISVWTLLNQYERTLHIPTANAAPFADGTMKIPEDGNGVPDILDEARWQIEFMLSMQVPEGGIVEGVLREGMVHHKVHDLAWTALGVAPAQDAMARYLYPPSTAATLNVAAIAAQCARIWAAIDADFAARCLSVAESAWTAAVANPAVYAENNFTGGGPYDDDNVSDEFYWAAAELFISTHAQKYEEFLRDSPHFLAIPSDLDSDGELHGSMDWSVVGALGTISLALIDNDLPAAQQQAARRSVINAASSFVTIQDGEGYGVPIASDGGYPWGSNSFTLNNMLIMGLAYDFSGDKVFLHAVSEAMDYLLGRNPMDQSYVTGYGERPLQNPHHRFWANQLFNSLPTAPPGAISGGPNSELNDPYVQTLIDECAPQLCFVDHIEAWSTNEITINWNAPFAWVTAFLDENANAVSAAYNYGTLTIPVATDGNRHYRLQFTLYNPSTLEFELLAADVLQNPDLSQVTIFENNTLKIPRVVVGRQAYRVEFTLTNADPIRLSLTVAEDL